MKKIFLLYIFVSSLSFVFANTNDEAIELEYKRKMILADAKLYQYEQLAATAFIGQGVDGEKATSKELLKQNNGTQKPIYKTKLDVIIGENSILVDEIEMMCDSIYLYEQRRISIESKHDSIRFVLNNKLGSNKQLFENNKINEADFYLNEREINMNYRMYDAIYNRDRSINKQNINTFHGRKVIYENIIKENYRFIDDFSSKVIANGGVGTIVDVAVTQEDNIIPLIIHVYVLYAICLLLLIIIITNKNKKEYNGNI